jgi:hypothetical protein
MRIGDNSEACFNSHHDISVSIAGISETGASGKMISEAMVKGAGRTDRSGLA